MFTTGLLQDVRYSLRQMRKNPGFAASAIIVLALGIGATTGMLAIVQSVLMRPLSYWQPERLVLVSISKDVDEQYPVVPIADFGDLQRSLHQFQELAALNATPVPVQTDDGTQMLLAPEVSTNFFETLGVLPAMGRPFREGDDTPGAGAAIVSYEFWQNSMHASKTVLGGKLKVNGEFYSVVGVMPPHFQFPVTYGKTVWTTLQLTLQQKTKQGFDNFRILGRLRPGATVQQVRAEGEAYLRHRKPSSASAAPMQFGVFPYQGTVTGDTKPALLALLAACVVLLLIAVVNTANLQIARFTARQGEIAVRSALGASRARMVRQTIVDSVTLAVAGAALGCLLAQAFVATARQLFPDQPRFDALRLDPWALLGCLLVTLASGVAAAIAPSWRVLGNRQTIAREPSSGGRISRQHRLSGSLVAAEVALSTVLLIAAGLFLRTLRSLQNVPLGFNPDHVTTFLLWAEGGNSMPMAVKVSAYQRVLDRLEHLPTVEAAGLITSLPAANLQVINGSGFAIPGIVSSGQEPAPSLNITAISPDYFRAMGIPLLMGRGLSASDAPSTQFAGIANRALVEKYLHGMNPIGQQVVLDKPSGILQPITIVGVSGDVAQEHSIGEPVEPELEVLFSQLPPSADFSQYMIGFVDGFAVHTRSSAGDIAASIRAIVKSEAPDFAIDNLVPLSQSVKEEMKTQRLALEITSCFTWIAALLSVAGLYAVLAYVVGQRIHEMGIRLALGATRGNVFGLIVSQGLWMVGAGLVCGWAAALFAGRWIRSFLFGVTIADPLTYVLVGILVAVASAVAILAPAIRAARVNPMVALRYE